MADKVTSTDTLSMVASFYDGDTRTITQSDPKPIAQQPALIRAFATLIKENNLLIGDLAGAAFKEFTQAKITHKTVTEFDLG